MKELKTMKVKELRELAKKEGLKIGGTKKELIERLLAKRTGVSSRYAGQQTICRICGARVIVKNTSTKILDDGRMLITRQVKCVGKNKHTYPIKEMLPAQK